MSASRNLIFFAVLCTLSSREAGAHGAYHDEIQRLDVLLSKSPEDALIRFQRACLNLSHGEWQQAMHDVELVDRLAPGEYPVDFVRGQALAAGSQFAEARAALDHFLKSRPGHAPALAVRARVLLKLDKQEDAFADFRAALTGSAAPEPDLYQEFAEALAARGRQNDAASVLQEGIRKLGNIPSLVSKALDLETATGQFDAALARVDAMQKAAPRPEPWMAKRAQLLAQAGRGGESHAAWQALAAHIAKLPNLERGSHAMSMLAEQAAQHAAAPPALFETRPADRASPSGALLVFPKTPIPSTAPATPAR